MTMILDRLVEGIDDSELHVERTDINWRNVAPGRVRVEIVVRGLAGPMRGPVVARVEAAPLGAFVPWRPLGDVLIPALERGQSYRAMFEAHEPPPTRLDAGRARVSDLLTALDNEDRPPLDPRWVLPGDILGMIGLGRLHWAGNLRILVGSSAVERHEADMRVCPGRENFATFLVGGYRPDAYAFSLIGQVVEWGAALYRSSSDGELFRAPAASDVLEEDEWIPMPLVGAVVLVMSPPSGAKRGSVDVRVKQRTTGQVATVEFHLDVQTSTGGSTVR